MAARRVPFRTMGVSSMALKSILFALALFLWPSVVQAVTYYVDAARPDDSATCDQAKTEGLAKKTIKAGLSCATTAGDTVLVNNGTYDEGTIVSGDFPVSGTSWTVPITLKANQGHSPIIQPGGPQGTHPFIFQWVTTQRNYIVIDGFDLDGTNVEFHGIRMQNDSHHIRIQNNTIHDSFDSCIKDDATGSNIEILNNVIHDCGDSDNGTFTVAPGNGSDSHGIYLDSPNGIITGNEIYNSSGTCIQLKGSTYQVNGNICYDNGLSATGACPGGLCGFNVVAVNVTATATNTDIYDNIFYNITGGIIYRNSSTGNIYNNTLYDFIDAGGGDFNGIEIATTAGNGIVVRDNIVQEGVGGQLNYGIRVHQGPLNTEIKNNICTGNASGDDCWHLFTGQGETVSGNINAVADLESPDFRDFRLKAAGNAVGAATDGGDIGACSFASPQAICTSKSSIIYYVDQLNGSDGFPCTAGDQTKAQATVQSGIACLQSGNTLLIKPGAYTMVEAAGNTCATEIPSGGGSWDTATTLQGTDPNNKPIIKIDGINDNFVFDFFSSSCTEDSYIILDNLIIDGTGTGSQNIKTSGSSNHIRLSNSECRNAFSHCWLMQGAAHNDPNPGGFHEALDNWIHDNVTGGSIGSHGIYLASSNNEVARNIIHDSGNFCTQMASPPAAGFLRNKLHHNECFNQGGGMQLHACKECEMKYNIVHNSGLAPESNNGSTFGIKVGGFSRDSVVEHNTIYDFTCFNTGGGILIIGNGNITVKNNIIEKTGGVAGCYGIYLTSTPGSGSTLLVDNNYIFDVSHLGNRGEQDGVQDITGSPGTVTITNIVLADPGLTDPINNDYSLEPGAATIDLSTTSGAPCVGVGLACDLGACEETAEQAICQNDV